MRLLCIQNNGSGSVRLSFDGGTGYTPTSPGGGPPGAGTKGTNPTATTGYLLAGSTEVNLTSMPQNAGLRAPIIGILANANASTTLDFVSDDVETTFPTS